MAELSPGSGAEIVALEKRDRYSTSVTSKPTTQWGSIDPVQDDEGIFSV